MIPNNISPADLNKISTDTLLQTLDIEFVELGADYLVAKMPVNEKTQQPMGLLHGGASVALAESIGSIGTYLMLNTEKQTAVGLEINANHVGSVHSGFVFGKGTIIHKGKTTHIWNIEIRDGKDKMISVCRLTMLILDRKK
ncbi:MAG: hotdog fold thioesterase [Crocinitomicaceae bacterium]|jgi:1,4-dihydroxy-2-naphthoyl-CoA hydrolase|nr:hotdog fold thioesterase [Crocinitomicaceae bacterium]MBT5402255.1 hotdog fold thioesterase [Crocinitomicaceae bacterium]MBT6029196.1 hotdog fold thioesterase [Crocinitomicaceae bacterium]MBT6514001.1 hotdog fold thioesterase [Crocinitomicaceae bacterium]MDG2331331.1 hotdog fold thioesterase [Flavobacteriales bacterium]